MPHDHADPAGRDAGAVTAPSLLMLGVGRRLAAALALVAVIWLAVAWAMT